MTESHDHYQAAIQLRNHIVSGQSNERPAQAWASVARECAKASDAFRREETGIHGRRHQAFLNSLDAVWWFAKAQIETLARLAASPSCGPCDEGAGIAIEPNQPNYPKSSDGPE